MLDLIAGCSDDKLRPVLRSLFDRPNFRVSMTSDKVTVEMCGALKNIVGVAAGLVDGLKMGNNTKASIIRLGMLEMMEFIK